MKNFLKLFVFPTLIGLVSGMAILWLMSDNSAAELISSPAPASYASTISRASPSVVNIYSSKPIHPQEVKPSEWLSDPYLKQFFNDQTQPEMERLQSSLGSGVIITEDGQIVTNYHVIADASNILVATSSGKIAQANVIGTDPLTDLALLKINLDHLQPISFSRSILNIGDIVFAIGNPFGIGQTASMGVVSATGRHNVETGLLANFIQTDAAINPGNSGGALVNTRGELVGISTSIFRVNGNFVGIGFAIPLEQVLEVTMSLAQHGRVIRGYLGAEMHEVPVQALMDQHIPEHFGLQISSIDERGPAQLAGLKPGDILISFNQKPLLSARQARMEVIDRKPGETLSVGFYRMGQRHDAEITLGSRPTQ
ncbi:S1C family serine protease [Gynuella sunshinyii]|uniref:Trypsin-like serine protease, typically periplasmic, containing C-terminal PDZ domain n=1 Tax=Gynuella sunshinyii YC6258 TaxID=1445510 RepID=A0A0C5VT41_9GAMM|nr:trypsin-like peptidase domain-containing protein [Gynuella sunshinyii]AJQ96498.1 trypsin-like serine protease, typically periplasmic, containing C-terminal PDZ domain [Gynuella sunshinyii YC6258]